MKRVMVEMTREWLKKHGYDGLYNHEKGCSCSSTDLLCCNGFLNGCVAAVKTNCNCADKCKFHLKPVEDEETPIH